jgi:hypothetical protein
METLSNSFSTAEKLNNKRRVKIKSITK